MIVDVFCDASARDRQFRGDKMRFGGAYVVGLEGRVIGVELTGLVETSTQAELMTAAIALREAKRMYDQRSAELVLHIDVVDVMAVLRSFKGKGAMDLAHELNGVQVLTDARRHDDYRRCHNCARRMAGLKHAKSKGGKKRKRQRSASEPARDNAAWGMD